MNIVSKSTIELHSDIPQPVHETHKCGILHAKNNQSGEEHSKRQHCFVWLSDTSHFANAHDHLVQSGYNDVVFVPYSCQKSWIENHPSAPLHMYTDPNGNCVNTAAHSAHPSSATHRVHSTLAPTTSTMFMDGVGHGRRWCICR